MDRICDVGCLERGISQGPIECQVNQPEFMNLPRSQEGGWWKMPSGMSCEGMVVPC